MKVLVALALVSAGCADNRETLFVRQVQAFDEECVVTPDPGAVFHTGGLLDVAFQGGYTLTPIIENQMVVRESRESVRAESNGVQIDGAIIRLYETDDPTLPPEETAPVLEFFSYASSYIEPASVGASIFTAIPPEYTAGRYRDLCGIDRGGSFADYRPRTDLVLVGATVQGITNGGLSVESPEFFFPVSLCCGCLVSCPPEADDPEIPSTTNFCDSADEVTDAICALGQDDEVDCRIAKGINDSLLIQLSLCQ